LFMHACRLANAARVKQLVREYNLRVKKKWGQHFVVSPAVIERLVELAEVSASDLVIEVGPGLGALTELLAQRARQVVAVEIDASLLPVLRSNLAAYPNVALVEGDILEVDLPALAAQYQHGPEEEALRCKIVGNLPYYLASPLTIDLLRSPLRPACLAVMVQKEVARRMLASPGGKDYGLLSIAVQFYARVEWGGSVPPSAFWPQPEVDSALVKLVPWDKPPCTVVDEGFFFAVARAALGQRRKTLLNALKGAPVFKTWETARLANALAEAGIAPSRRGETLSLEELARLANLLYSLR